MGKLLPVRVLIDGKPAAGIELIGDYRGAPHQVSAVTDAAGRAQVMVRNEGLNIIAAEANLPVANDPDIETRGLFTSLTFLGEAHRE
ncbi:Nickel uptake substrate-specific transmembrane region [compost metagenome]